MPGTLTGRRNPCGAVVVSDTRRKIAALRFRGSFHVVLNAHWTMNLCVLRVSAFSQVPGQPPRRETRGGSWAGVASPND